MTPEERYRVIVLLHRCGLVVNPISMIHHRVIWVIRDRLEEV